MTAWLIDAVFGGGSVLLALVAILAIHEILDWWEWRQIDQALSDRPRSGEPPAPEMKNRPGDEPERWES